MKYNQRVLKSNIKISGKEHWQAKIIIIFYPPPYNEMYVKKKYLQGNPGKSEEVDQDMFPSFKAYKD